MAKIKETENVFTDIYKKNGFQGTDSISGPGSDIYQTRIIVEKLPIVFREFNISGILDIPCGDFHWMNTVDLSEVDYIGADIVSNLIEKNMQKYETDSIHFKKLDLLTDKLPKVDLVFSRDCLVHLAIKDIFLALANICSSDSKYFLSTTFTKRVENSDIKTGQWRPLNLEIAPFFLPRPLKVINEGCTENGGIYSDKALGLWKISDIKKSLRCSSSIVKK